MGQLLGRESFDDVTFIGIGNEGIVFLSGSASLRLEPMSEMGGIFSDCPLLHGMCDIAGNGFIEGISGLDGLHEFFVDFAAEFLAHDGFCEGQFPKNFSEF